MFVSKKIIDAAVACLEKEGEMNLPLQIAGYPAFYLDLPAKGNLQAFGGVVFKDKEYVIGTKK
ncbi:MAG: hypothetical protein IT475_13825 [Aquimonas sp.]|nr:hypothetical protein [Aquimonas sp.]